MNEKQQQWDAATDTMLRRLPGRGYWLVGLALIMAGLIALGVL